MKCYLAYSANPDVRHKASTGGFCKEFLRFCIEGKIIDKSILTILGEGEEALIPRTIITDDIEKIMSTKSNSIYDKTNPLSILSSLNKNESYIFVGLPCHIYSVKKYCSKHNIRIITISLFCNHTSDNKYYKSVLDKANLSEIDVKHFEYRGSGWPGFEKIITNEDQEIKIDHIEGWDNYVKKYMQMLPKCKVCTRMISEEADICVGDAWMQKVLNNDSNGTNMVVAMTTTADKLVMDCCKSGYIHIEHLDISEFEAQNNRSVKIKKDRREAYE
ncbi:MAG: Coenzyme F420 hydrogenase/dehydrogenase, beta subunit C-terminal domain [Melioribacteraceae bacterium]